MKFLISIFVILAVFFLLIRLFENRFIYFPFKYPQGHWQPDSFGLRVEDCYFEAQDGVELHGWFFKHEKAVATMLWCHGNAGNITDRLHNIAELQKIPINVFIFDYRGYGRSKGSPDEKGIYLDAEAAYDYLLSRDDVSEEKVIIFGRSLGGAVVVDLATRKKSAGLILESTFTNAKDMAKSAFGFIPVHLIIKTKLNSIDKISQITTPILFVHGTADRVVPYELGRRLFEQANEPKEFYDIEGADHNDTYIVGGAAYFEKLHAFIHNAISNSP